MENISAKKGITLMVLAITIIILLLLAGIAIGSFLSNDGICRFVKHMRHPLMLKGFIAILLFFCC